MKWNRFITSAAVLFSCCLGSFADESIFSKEEAMDEASASPSKYDLRVNHYREHWAALIPTQFVIQNAGNMGVVSLGIGWDYGKRKQWETDLLFGYIPKHQSSRGKLTMTLKENYIPWSFALRNPSKTSGWSFEPLTASIYINTVYGHEFWKSQPNRYPDSYYDFMSTKFRLNAAIGQRFTFTIPHEKRKGSKSISLFYEISTCDLYLRARIVDHNVPWKDVLGLSLGIKIQTL